MKSSWKKAVGLLALSSVMVLGACSGDEQTTSTEKDTSSKQETKKETKETAKIELGQETYQAWKDSIDTVWVNYSAEIKNTGDAPANVSGIQINYEDAEGNVLGTSSFVTAVPGVINPGETAYITDTTTLDATKDPAALTKAYANIDFGTATDGPHLLTTSNVVLTEKTDEWDRHSPYIVTGSIINEGDVKADDIRVAAGLYDKNDKLVGVLNGSLDVSLAPDGKAAFQLDYPEVGDAAKGKAKTVKVAAYNWSF